MLNKMAVPFVTSCVATLLLLALLVSSGRAEEKKIKYWVAPMDPTYIRNEPGKSPMGMDLVPVYEDDSQSGSTISVDPVTVQNMGVRTAPVVRGDLSRNIRTLGLIAYAEPMQYQVNLKVAGWVEKLYVNETGQQVKKGQPLLEIYSPELLTAQQELILAKENYDALAASPFSDIVAGAARLLDASRQRLSLWDISAAQVQQIEKSGQVQKRLTLKSPYSGIVSAKMVNEGMYIKPGMPLLEISDLQKIWVYADLYESEIPFVKVGQSARVTLPYVNAEPRHAQVSYLYPTIDVKTRTLKSRLEFDNNDLSLRPDMYVNVEIEAGRRHNVLSVPVTAVLNSGAEKRVFVARGDGKFEPRTIKTGMQGDDGRVEVLEGVVADERVVTSAQFMFDSESRLREAIAKMLEPQSPANPAADEVDDLFDDKDPAATRKNLEDLF